MFDWNYNRNLIKNPEIEKFIKYFAKEDKWHHQDKKRGGLGYGWIHYSLIRLLNPKNVLCVGSKWGFIPAVCALACRDNGKGMVDFVDAGYDIKDYGGVAGEHWGGEGFWKKCNAKKYFGKFGLEKNISLQVMKSKEYADKNKNKKYGYVHIDGDHSYLGVKLDFDLFWPRVETGGFLAIHDVFSPDRDGNVYGTRKFWEEIIKSGKYKLIEIKEDPGVGIIQKS
ncbi:MAG: class I SAM-dependent methyltransferase [Candidatus Shapirobacteria bacterium]